MQEATAVQVPNDNPTGGCSAPLLLLAEDDDELRALLARALRHEGYNVTELNDGTQLLHALVAANLSASQSAISLVISDIRMPGLSGLDVLAGIDWALSTIPVVLMTGFGDHEIHGAAKSRGAVAVLDKPFDLDDLLALVAKLLSQAPEAASA